MFIPYVLGGRPCAQHIMQLKNSHYLAQWHYDPHFTDGGPEAQGGKITGLVSELQLEAAHFPQKDQRKTERTIPSLQWSYGYSGVQVSWEPCGCERRRQESLYGCQVTGIWRRQEGRVGHELEG